ncbi:helix-turn-helix transcriptional regulator [Sphingomonas sp. KRR8]|uniref:response regulator transcription factor n=1 Tax=Sphingomonas sp. KRR8 TaxID=2942996 RepID=UPI00202218C6|nr:helix-turn-helix transcriptional regulator [Sphingomonas sp. KRR8]URD60739.1 helix-turn-helix transcriptional regulator [Sphingomonas sp. KRR8]
MNAHKLLLVEPAQGSLLLTPPRPAPTPDRWLTGATPSNPFACLSERERQIAALVAEGSSNKEIARLLDISPNTVSSHLRQIFAKLGLVRRAELCRLWFRAETVRTEA